MCTSMLKTVGKEELKQQEKMRSGERVVVWTCER